MAAFSDEWRVAREQEADVAEQFGAYEIERRLGAGGMAEVFLAHRRGPEGFAKRVALKRVLPAYNADPEFVRLFQDEARLAARLDHPHVAGLNDFGEVDGEWYMAMEYVEGADLRTVLAGLKQLGQPLPTDLVTLVAVDLASALLYAHELEVDGRPASVIHRDVTPSNILVSVDGAIRLADFGIARATTHGHHTRTGIVKGKVPYMPPEQALGQDMDHRVDLFALGVVLYECIAGKRPYDGATELDTLQRINKGLHAPLLELAPHAPLALAQTIERLIRPDAAHRFACAADVLDALATTPPPTNARRLLGNLVRRVQKELPPVVHEVRAKRSSPRVIPPDERTRPMKRDEVAAVMPPAALGSAPPGALAPPVVAGLGAESPPPAFSRPALRGDPTTVIARAGTARSGAARARSPWPVRVIGGVLVALSLASALAVGIFAWSRANAESGRDAGKIDAPLAAFAMPEPHATTGVLATAENPSALQRTAPAPVAVPEPVAAEPVAVAVEPTAGVERARARGASGRERSARIAAPASVEARTEVAVLPGRVHVVALPVGDVMIDGRPYGASPVVTSMRPGRHTIVVRNGEHEERRTIELASEATERIVFRFPMSR